MTKISHYVSSINHKDDFVWVMFQEIPTNETMIKYIAEAAISWKECNMPGELPQNIIDQLRVSRFKNQFEMKFPFVDWVKRDLKIQDKVEIDMPLRLTDIVSAGIDEGV